MSGRPTPGSQETGELILKVYEGPRIVAQFTLLRSTEIGRRETHDPVPYAKIERPQDDRIVVAEMTETNVSRRHHVPVDKSGTAKRRARSAFRVVERVPQRCRDRSRPRDDEKPRCRIWSPRREPADASESPRAIAKMPEGFRYCWDVAARCRIAN